MSYIQKNWKEIALEFCIKEQLSPDCLKLVELIDSFIYDEPAKNHPIREAILTLLKTNNGSMKLHYRGIARKIGEIYPEKIKYHLLQLKKSGELDVDFKNKIIKLKK